MKKKINSKVSKKVSKSIVESNDLFELTSESIINFFGIKLFRIKAKVD